MKVLEENKQSNSGRQSMKNSTVSNEKTMYCNYQSKSYWFLKQILVMMLNQGQHLFQFGFYLTLIVIHICTLMIIRAGFSKQGTSSISTDPCFIVQCEHEFWDIRAKF